MNILVTGSKGFIGKNLVTFIKENHKYNIIEFIKGESDESLNEKLIKSDFIIHLAGVNRPKEKLMFKKTNINLTKYICEFLQNKSIKSPIIFASSRQAILDNHYGISKYKAEEILKELNQNNGNPIYIYRLPGVFGKWCKPNYNSVVSTFCFNTVNGKKLKITDPNKKISLIYIDDVLEVFCNNLMTKNNGVFYPNVKPEYEVSIEEIAKKIENFYNNRENLLIDKVGNGLTRKLYSTFISFLNENQFSYPLLQNIDNRGKFVEILKTHDSGQFSFFTAHPGITRGGHYHNTKTEKFLVVHGIAKFKFKNLFTEKKIEIIVDAKNPIVVDTIPGWVHNITNIGDEELKVLLWSNEIFDKEKPDTYQSEV